MTAESRQMTAKDWSIVKQRLKLVEEFIINVGDGSIEKARQWLDTYERAGGELLTPLDE